MWGNFLGLGKGPKPQHDHNQNGACKDVYKRQVEAYNKRALPDVVAGKHISEVHPASKIGNAVRGGRFDETCFYFASDVTNIAKIKNLYKDGTLVGAIDYDIFTDGQELKDFLDKIAAYSEKGFLNLQDTFRCV